MKNYLISTLILSIVGALVALILFMMFLFGIVGQYESYIYFLVAYGAFQVVAMVCLALLGVDIWRKNRGDETEQHYQKNIHK